MSTETIIIFAVLVPSVILHEIAHGAVALWFGDDTAKRAGRLTLNPVPHIDPFGTVLLPALLALSGLGAFGWAKPVPVSPSRLRNPRQQTLLVSLAGPATNIALALAAALWFATRDADAVTRVLFDLPGTPMADRVVFFAGFVNVILAAFNLIPLPPLDGSAVIERFLPHTWWPQWLRFRQYSMGILLLVVLLLPGALDRVFDPAIRLWARLL